MKLYIRSSESSYIPTIDAITKAIKSLQKLGFKLAVNSKGAVAISPDRDFIYGWKLQDVLQSLTEEPVSSYDELKEYILDILYDCEYTNEAMPYDPSECIDVFEEFKEKYLK